MLSTFPSMLCPESFLQTHEQPVLLSPTTQVPEKPVSSNSGFDIPNSGSDERKRRRMISNRESARRSRLRKQKHLENLRNQLNRLGLRHRELMNQVRFVLHQDQLVRRENEHLRSETASLQQRLWDIRQVLLVRQLQQQLNPSAWPCNNFTSVNEGKLQQHYSLIT